MNSSNSFFLLLLINNVFHSKFDTKPDEELFTVDAKGDDDDVKPDIKPLSAKLQKRAKLAETPKCFEILLPSSKVILLDYFI